MARLSQREVEVYRNVVIRERVYLDRNGNVIRSKGYVAGNFTDPTLEGIKRKIDLWLATSPKMPYEAQIPIGISEDKKKEEEEVDMAKVETAVTQTARPIGFAEGGWTPQEPIAGQRSKAQIPDVKKLSAEGVKEEFPWTWLIIAGIGIVILLVLLK